MNECLLMRLGRGMLALAFMGPGGTHLIDAWRDFQMPSSVAIAMLECGAGLAVLLGWQVRWVALALAVFLVGDAFATHGFWRAAPPEQQNQLLHFFKNLQGARRSTSWSA